MRHLYLHVPFCAHRCGYCDFVTVIGAREEVMSRYVDALLTDIVAQYGREELERAGAYRVYADPAELLARADEVGVRNLAGGPPDL